MAVRRDSIQIDVQIKADQGVRQFQALTDDGKKLTNQLNALEKAGKKNTAEYKKTADELAKVNRQMAELGGKGATLGQLTGRARTLNNEIKSLAPGTNRFIEATKELTGVKNRMSEIRQQTSNVSGGLNSLRVGTVAAIGAIGLAFSKVSQLFSETIRLYDVQAKADAQLQAALKSTGEVAGRTFEQLSKQADDLQKKTLFGDEATQGAQSLLLTFTNVREEIFDRTVPTILDLATAMKTDLQSATVQVGKALNDPIKGLAGLSKAGIQFSDDQKKTITALVETGKVAEAQTLILKELETQFGGSAEAAAKAGSGGLTQFINRVNDIKELIGKALIPVINLLSRAAEPFIELLERFLDIPVSEKLKDEQAEFNTLTKALINNTDNQEIRNSLIKELQSKYPQYIKNINLETASIAELEGLLADVNKEFAKKIILQEQEEKLSDITRERLKLTKLQIQAEKALADGRQLFFAGGSISPEKQLESLAARMADVDEDFQKALNEQNTLLNRFGIIQGEVSGKQKIIIEDTEEETDKTKESTKATKEKTKSLAEQLAIIKQAEIEKQKQEVAATKRAASGFSGGFVDAGAFPSDSSDADIIEQRKIDFELEQELLKENFFNSLITEQEYQDQLYQLQQTALQRRLDAMKIAGQEQSLEGVKIQNEILENQRKHEDERTKLVEKSAELRSKAEQMVYDVFSGLVGQTIELLGADEDARKKNAGLIKALSAGKIIADGFQEIQSIWATANANPSNILFPGSGTLIAGVKTAAAAIRTATALQKVSSIGFYGGGHTGNNALFNDKQGRGIVGGVHKNEWVAPEWMTQNPNYSSMINYLETARQRGFKEGGFTSSNTTPSIDAATLSPSGNQPSSIAGDLLRMFIESNNRLNKTIQEKDFNIKSGQLVDALDKESSLNAAAEF